MRRPRAARLSAPPPADKCPTCGEELHYYVLQEVHESYAFDSIKILEYDRRGDPYYEVVPDSRTARDDYGEIIKSYVECEQGHTFQAEVADWV